MVSYYGKGALLALGLDLKIREFSKNRQSLDDLMRLIWKKHGITLDGIAEDGLDVLIHELLGAGFSKTWNAFKSRYIFGVEDIPVQKWFDSGFIKVQRKFHTNTETIKLQFGMRHTDANGWLKVTHVLNGGAAQEAGLAPGDLLASINGQRITASRWEKILSSLTENQAIIICFYREDLEHECMTFLRNEQIPVQYQLEPVQ